MPQVAFSQADMAVIRRAYAKQMVALAGIPADPRLEDAFASVPREKFLGPGPWQAMRPFVSYESTPSDDPAILYQDALFALSPRQGINNGSPSLHARWLHALSPREGERIVHIGAGTGYYTAMIAQLVGEKGHVLAIEFDPALADAARANLEGCPNVTVIAGDGPAWPQEAVDGIYVNFSVERPAEAWIANLREGGRLVFPLGVPGPKRRPTGGVYALYGAGFCITRLSTRLAARWLNPASFVCAEGALSEPDRDRERLQAAFERGGAEFVSSLIWREPVLPQRCWFAGSGWALSYDEVSR